ncbi:hypothetical protein NECAME_10500 [Necator americanus]|uniref:Uncharacterized protein n=1 Tax=Necator americanus TaxID=51031 RepID=W2T830_NECAM|nr:hypothetical protein NECAME_10500 [Necator americanus]ETN78180.1 hypothetical protein NECAME_10500 [Necator americanus]
MSASICDDKSNPIILEIEDISDFYLENSILNKAGWEIFHGIFRTTTIETAEIVAYEALKLR